MNRTKLVRKNFGRSWLTVSLFFCNFWMRLNTEPSNGTSDRFWVQFYHIKLKIVRVKCDFYNLKWKSQTNKIEYYSFIVNCTNVNKIEKEKRIENSSVNKLHKYTVEESKWRNIFLCCVSTAVCIWSPINYSISSISVVYRSVHEKASK